MFIIEIVSLLALVVFVLGIGYLVVRWCWHKLDEHSRSLAPTAPDELIDEVPHLGGGCGGTVPPQDPQKPASEPR